MATRAISLKLSEVGSDIQRTVLLGRLVLTIARDELETYKQRTVSTHIHA